MKKFWFSVLCLLMISTGFLLISGALGQGSGGHDVLTPVPISEDDVSNLLAIATQYNLSNQGVAIQIRSQIRNTVQEWFNDAFNTNSPNVYRERIGEIAEDVEEYDFNYFCPPAVVMTPRDAAIGWIIDKAKEQAWLRRLYADYCPTEPDSFLTGIRDYIQDNNIPLTLRQACARISDAAENCAEIDTTKCTEIEELLIPKIEAEIEACEDNSNWVAANVAGAVAEDAASTAIVSVDPCAFAYRHLHRARRALELCNKYIDTCVARCDRIDAIVDECERVASNKDLIIANLTARLRNFCVMRGITDEVNQHINETVSNAEIIPVIVVTWLNTTESDFTYVDSVELLRELNETKIFRVRIRANRFSDLKKEPFVLRAALDHVVRALNLGRYAYKRVSSIAPNATKNIIAIEAIKKNIDPILQPDVETSEDEIDDISEELTTQEDNENGRGPFYAFLRFLGLAAATETSDSSFYEQKAQQLGETISKLEGIAETTADDVAAATLLDTANELQQKVQEMQQRAQQKRANARGIFSFLFGGG